MANNNRASWAGILRIEDTKLPFKLMPASDDMKVELNMICKEHKARVEQTYQCSAEFEYLEEADCGRAKIYSDGPTEIVLPIPVETIEFGVMEGQHISITEFRNAYDFDPAWIVKSYRSWTEPWAEGLYAALWRSMDRLRVVGYGSLVMAEIRYPAALQAVGTKEFVVHRMHWPQEMRPGLQITEERAKPPLVKGFTDLLQKMHRESHEPMFADIVNERYEKLSALVKTAEEEKTEQLVRMGLG